MIVIKKRFLISTLLFLGLLIYVTINFGTKKINASSSIATISSNIYTVSDNGGGSAGTILGVPTNTAKTDFLLGLIKDDPNEIWDDSTIGDPVLNGDYLTVVSEDTFNQNIYTVIFSDVRTISSSTYVINGDESEGTITNVPTGVSKAVFLSNITKGNTNQIWDDSELQDPVQPGDKLSVLAQSQTEGRGLLYTVVVSNIATVSSDTLTIEDDENLNSYFTDVPEGMSKASFISAINPDGVNQTWDESGINDPVSHGDTLTVIAQDGVTEKNYYISRITLNNPPVASSVSIQGSPNLGQSLTGSYVYNDIDENIWTNLGQSTGITDGSVGDKKIILDDSGKIYVIFSDINYNQKISAMVYDQNSTSPSWQYLGERGFSEFAVTQTLDLAVDSNGVLYVAYFNGASGSPNKKPLVMKYDQNSINPIWSAVGTLGSLNYNAVISVTLKIDSSNVLYLSFNSVINQFGLNGAIVKKYDPSEQNPDWTIVGSEYFTAENISFLNLELDKYGVPYVGFEDFRDGVWTPSHASSMKYNSISNSWDYVGQRGGVSPDEIGYITLNINKTTNNLYAIYQDWRDTHPAPEDHAHLKSTVVKYNTSSFLWEPIGDEEFSSGIIGRPSIGSTEDDVVYVSYKDQGKKKGVVAKFDPSQTSPSWETLPYFSVGTNVDLDMTIGEDDVPYVAFADVLDNYKLKVIKLNTDFGDNEGHSIFQWYRDGIAISGATSINYVIQENDLGRTITFGVIPVAVSGAVNGDLVISSGLSISSASISNNNNLGVSGGSVNSPISLNNLINTNKPQLINKIIEKYYFNRNLKFGSFSEDVKRLQQYLNSSQFLVSKIGPGSIENETMFFGRLTKNAVIKFQKSNNLVPDGIVGPKTRSVINK